MDEIIKTFGTVYIRSPCPHASMLFEPYLETTRPRLCPLRVWAQLVLTLAGPCQISRWGLTSDSWFISARLLAPSQSHLFLAFLRFRIPSPLALPPLHIRIRPAPAWSDSPRTVPAQSPNSPRTVPYEKTHSPRLILIQRVSPWVFP